MLDLESLKRQARDDDDALSVLTDYRLECGDLNVEDMMLHHKHPDYAVIQTGDPGVADMLVPVRQALEMATRMWLNNMSNRLWLYILGVGDEPVEMKPNYEWVTSCACGAEDVTDDFHISHGVLTNHRTVGFVVNKNAPVNAVAFVRDGDVLCAFKLTYPASCARGAILKFVEGGLRVTLGE